jgi:hypothetical protein
MPMKRIRVLNGHAESEIWIERLRAAGYDVDARKVRAPDDLKALGRPVPAAVAIDLARAPGHGRDLGLAVRQMKATRQLPLVFVDGTTQQVERLRACYQARSTARAGGSAVRFSALSRDRREIPSDRPRSWPATRGRRCRRSWG